MSGTWKFDHSLTHEVVSYGMGVEKIRKDDTEMKSIQLHDSIVMASP